MVLLPSSQEQKHEHHQRMLVISRCSPSVNTHNRITGNCSDIPIGQNEGNSLETKLILKNFANVRFSFPGRFIHLHLMNNLRTCQDGGV